MSVIFVLLPAALLFAAAAVIVFLWAVRSGQFDDLDTPAMRILGEDDEERAEGRPADGIGSEDARPPRA